MYRVLVGKPEGKRTLGRPRHRWVDNIRMDLQEVGCGYVDWIGMAQDRDNWRTLVSVVMNLRVQWHTQEFCSGGGSTNSVEDRGQREQASGDGSPIARVSGHSRSLVQNFYYINYNFLNFWYFKTTYYSNEFICQC